MKVTLNKTDNVNGNINIAIEKADYQENVNKSIKQYRNKANIPGFRQGKVSIGIIQKMYGKSLLMEEINKLVSTELYKCIKDNELNILGEPLPNESKQKEIDFDKDENFEFDFEIALAPEFDLSLNKRDKLSYYEVKLEDDLLEKQIEAYKQNYGSYRKIEEKAVDTDLIKGTITELEKGKPKTEGIVIENGIIMPSYIKEEVTKNKFVGSNVGDKVVFNPKTAYDNNEAEVASLLQTTKENVKDINSDFSFEIQEITRYQEAEMNQELYDKVLGKDVATDEASFKEKIGELLSNQFKPNADSLFMESARELILKKMKDVTLPEPFLKRWLLISNEKNTEESIEKDFPKITEDLKFHLAKEKIAKEQNLKIENSDLESLATNVARTRFAQYGMSNVPEEMLKNYAQSLLNDENTLRGMYEKVMENKIGDWLKETVKVNSQSIGSKEFNDLLTERENKNVPQAETAE